MKSLAVYYSLDGSTELMAKTIAQVIDADILELQPIKEINSIRFMKYIWG